jgi:hypothetical protein
MERIRPGLIAGFIGVSISTMTNVICRVLGLFPEAMDLKYMAEVFVDPARDPVPAFLLGIVIHLVLGTVVGVVYALLVKPHTILTGVVFMTINWLLMMVILFPLTHRGFFGLDGGVIMPIATLALNLEYGLIVGPLVQRFSLSATPSQLRVP